MRHLWAKTYEYYFNVYNDDLNIIIPIIKMFVCTFYQSSCCCSNCNITNDIIVWRTTMHLNIFTVSNYNTGGIFFNMIYIVYLILVVMGNKITKTKNIVPFLLLKIKNEFINELRYFNSFFLWLQLRNLFLISPAVVNGTHFIIIALILYSSSIIRVYQRMSGIFRSSLELYLFKSGLTPEKTAVYLLKARYSPTAVVLSSYNSVGCIVVFL